MVFFNHYGAKCSNPLPGHVGLVALRLFDLIATDKRVIQNTDLRTLKLITMLIDFY